MGLNRGNMTFAVAEPETPQRQDVDVLVVGAGPVGLTTAIALGLRGVRVRVIDHSAAPTDLTKATLIHTRTLELLPPTIVHKIVEQSSAVDHIRLLDHRQGKTSLLAHLDFTPPTGLGMRSLPQSQAERILIDFLATLPDRTTTDCARHRLLRVRRGLSLVSLDESPRVGVTCELKKKASGRVSVVRTRYVVGADGSRSTVRSLLGLTLPATTLDDNLFAIHASFDHVPPALGLHSGKAGAVMYAKGDGLQVLPGPARGPPAPPTPPQHPCDTVRMHAIRRALASQSPRLSLTTRPNHCSSSATWTPASPTIC